MAWTSTDLDGILAVAGTDALLGSETVRVVWRNRYEAVELYDGRVESAGPYVLVKSTDVTLYEIDHGTELEIDSTTYTIVEIQPDGQGLTKLILERA